MGARGRPQPGSAPAEGIKESLKSSVKVLADLGLGSDLEREVLRRLIDGRMTATELVELIYHASRSDAGFHAEYMKVKRAVRRLENRGLVATKLFGRDKPYRLTVYALETLYNLGQSGRPSGRLIPRTDLVVHISTLLAGGATLAVIWAGPQLPQPMWVFSPAALFLVFLGVSLCRISNLMRRVL